jgi:hypothetical protein
MSGIDHSLSILILLFQGSVVGIPKTLVLVSVLGTNLRQIHILSGKDTYRTLASRSRAETRHNMDCRHDHNRRMLRGNGYMVYRHASRWYQCT